MVQSKPTKLPVLRSESADDYLALRARLTREIKPEGGDRGNLSARRSPPSSGRSSGYAVSGSASSTRRSARRLQSVLEQLLFNPDLLMRT